MGTHREAEQRMRAREERDTTASDPSDFIPFLSSFLYMSYEVHYGFYIYTITLIHQCVHMMGVIPKLPFYRNAKFGDLCRTSSGPDVGFMFSTVKVPGSLEKRKAKKLGRPESRVRSSEHRARRGAGCPVHLVAGEVGGIAAPFAPTGN